MPLYRNILKQALRVTWRYKYLWFFGVFAAILSSSTEYDSVLRLISGQEAGLFSWFSKASQTGFFSGRTLANIVDNPSLVIIPLLIWIIVLVLFGFLIWLMIISQIALVDNTARIISSSKTVENLNIADGVEAGKNNFWSVLGLNLVGKLLIGLVFAIITFPVFISMGRSGLLSGLVYIILFVIFVPVAIALAFIIKYAICFTVIKGATFKESILKGWQLFKDNWLVSVEMALIIFVINFLVVIALILAAMIFSIPALFFAYLMFLLFSIPAFWLTVLLSVITVVVIVALVGASLTTFQISAWTGLFLELIKRGGESKIVRVMSVK